MVGTPLNNPSFQDLGEFGTTWVRDCLGRGEAFSKLVLSKIDLATGAVSIAVAVQEHQAAIASHKPLSHATINRSQIDTDLQIKMLLEKLRQIQIDSGPLVVIGEDNLVYPSDPIKNMPSLPRFLFGGRYYFAQELKAIQTYRDFEVLSLSSGYPLNVFVFPRNVLPDDLERGQIKSEMPSDIMATSVLAIINAAFDGETYTIWIKIKMIEKPE